MSDLLNKLSSYNLFNYLLPGVLFAALATNVTKYSFIQSDIVIGVFVYYFSGLVISRFGSLIIEPFLKWTSFIRFAKYEDFVSASDKDKKLEVLSEVNNTYRTIASLFILLLLLKLYEKLEVAYPILEQWNSFLIIIALLAMFLFSYQKQTNYIRKRVEVHQSSENKKS